MLGAAEPDTVLREGPRKTRAEVKKFNFHPETMCLLGGKQEKATASPLDEHKKQELKHVIRKSSRRKSHKLTKIRTSHSIQLSSLSRSRGYAKQYNFSGETSLRIALLLSVIMIPLMGPKSIFIASGPENVQLMSAIVVSVCCDHQKAKSEQQGC